MVHQMFTTHDAWHTVEVFIIFTTSGLSEEESYMLPNQTRNPPFAVYQANLAVEFEHGRETQFLPFLPTSMEANNHGFRFPGDPPQTHTENW